MRYHQQLYLFDMPEPEPKKWRKFMEYHKSLPEVYEIFEKYARQFIDRGYNKIGAQMLIERIRWEWQKKTGCDLKINNDWKAYYARLYLRDHPEHRGFFELRQQKEKNPPVETW